MQPTEMPLAICRYALSNESVLLEPASEANVEILVRWSLDPVAQGPFKTVPSATAKELRSLFLDDPERQYFLIRKLADGTAIGRFYWRAWRFCRDRSQVDWEINIFLADPIQRGHGLGSAAQLLAVTHLFELNVTRSVFAYTNVGNLGERLALERAGMRKIGLMPLKEYPLPDPKGQWVLYAAKPGAKHAA